MKLWLVALPFALSMAGCGDRSSTTDNAEPSSTSLPTAATDAQPARPGAALTEDAVKEWINESVQGLVNGSSSQPQAIALDFQSVDIADAQSVTNDQVVAGVRNDTYYPVTVHYTENDTYGADVRSKQVDYNYWFYVDQSGHWNAAKVGPA